MTHAKHCCLLLTCWNAWPCSIWGVIFALQGAGALYAALETGYQKPSKCAAVNAVGE